MKRAQSLLPRRDRLRRVVLLCCSVAQNATFYRAAVADPNASILSDRHPEAAFLRRTINNFLDIAVLDWCKLFGSQRTEKHHWRRVASDPAVFQRALFQELGTNANTFDMLVERFLYYRNTSVAHLDNDLVMNIPELDPALCSATFYHQYMVEREASPGQLTWAADCGCIFPWFRAIHR